MLQSVKVPSRAPPPSYLESGASTSEFTSFETGRKETHINANVADILENSCQVAGAPTSFGGHARPRNEVLGFLESLLVGGLLVTVELHPGTMERPSLGLEPRKAVLYLPLVRRSHRRPRLHVRMHTNAEPEGHQLQVCLSASTVCFFTKWGTTNCWSVSEGATSGCKLAKALLQECAASSVVASPSQEKTPLSETGCTVRLISCCGTLICFPAGPHAPLENQIAHDVLRIFGAFDFDTSRLYDCLCTAVKESRYNSQFADFLETLPLFALSQSWWVLKHAYMSFSHEVKSAPLMQEATAAEPKKESHRSNRSAEGEARQEDFCCHWRCWGYVDPALPWPTALACSWIVHIANHEDGVKERHALISSFRRFLLLARDKGPGIGWDIECCSHTETTVPSEATIAVVSVCGDAFERFPKSRQDNSQTQKDPSLLRLHPSIGEDRTVYGESYCGQGTYFKTKSLNPNAAPFVPRALPTVSRSSALLSLTGTGPHPHVESTGEASEKAAETATRTTTSKDGSAGAARVTASDASTSREPQRHTVESQRNQDENYPHTLLPFMRLDEHQHRKNSSSAASQRAPPRVQTAGILWKYPSTLLENEPRFQHTLIKSRPRSHSAPLNAAAVAMRLKASLGNCRYTPVALLGLRRQALLLTSSFEDLQFMLQQHPARCADELLSPVQCSPPSAISAPKGVKVVAHLHSVFSSAPAPCAPRTSEPDVSSVPPPPPPLPPQEESLQYRRSPWEHLHKHQPPGCPGTRAAQWEVRASGGPLLPLPRSSPGGPPLLPTPRVPPLTLSSYHPVDRGWLPNSYCISSGPATGVKGAAHPGVPWVMGGFFKEPTPMIHPVMQQGEPQVSLQRLVLQQHELMKHQLLQQRQQGLLQGSSLPAPLESKSYPTEQHVERAPREFKFPRKNSGLPRQRRIKQSPQELQKTPDILRTTVHGNQGIEPLSPCLPLSYEAALHKLLGMVNSLVLARSSCKEVQEQ